MTDAADDYFRKFPDHAIRDLLGNPDNLRELVAEVAPDVVDHFDFTRMKSVERQFHLEDWRGREADRLFELPYREAGMEAAVLVCILAEHQSTPDPMMPFRLLQYAVLYWDRQWKGWRERSTPRDPLQLNAVLPIVFYTGSRPWTTNHELSELIAGPKRFGLWHRIGRRSCGISRSGVRRNCWQRRECGFVRWRLFEPSATTDTPF